MASEKHKYQRLDQKKTKKKILGGGVFLVPQKMTFLKNSPRKARAKIFSTGVLDSSHGPLHYEKKKHWGVPTKNGGVLGVFRFQKNDLKFKVQKIMI